MEQLPGIAEDHKVGRLDTGLSHVVDLQAAALVRGGLHSGLGVCQDVIEHTGGDTHIALVVDKVNQLKNALGALAGERGDEEDGGIRHKREIAINVLAEVD